MSLHAVNFVVYVKKDGSVELGQACQNPSCAVASIHPDETAETYGPYTIEIDTDNDICIRSEKIDLNDPNVILRNLFGQHHPVVQS